MYIFVPFVRLCFVGPLKVATIARALRVGAKVAAVRASFINSVPGVEVGGATVDAINYIHLHAHSSGPARCALPDNCSSANYIKFAVSARMHGCTGTRRIGHLRADSHRN